MIIAKRKTVKKRNLRASQARLKPQNQFAVLLFLTAKNQKKVQFF
jgi:hypothetical protein